MFCIAVLRRILVLMVPYVLASQSFQNQWVVILIAAIRYGTINKYESGKAVLKGCLEEPGVCQRR